MVSMYAYYYDFFGIEFLRMLSTLRDTDVNVLLASSRREIIQFVIGDMPKRTRSFFEYMTDSIPELVMQSVRSCLLRGFLAFLVSFFSRRCSQYPINDFLLHFYRLYLLFRSQYLFFHFKLSLALFSDNPCQLDLVCTQFYNIGNETPFLKFLLVN